MRILNLIPLIFLTGHLSAQLLATKDSVEVHRTHTIYFDFGRANILPQADSVLEVVWQEHLPNLELYLEGHTDAVGSLRANELLSKRRAETVRKRMIELGWPAETTKIRSFGEQQLAVKTTAKEIRNRRVFIRTGLPQRYSLYRGRALDSLGLPLPASVIAHGKYLRDTTLTDENGFFEVWLPVDQVVGLDVYASGYFYHTQMLKVQTDEQPPLEIRLKKAVVGASMDIPDLYYVGNKDILLSRSKPALPRLLTFMRLNPDLSVEIAGHVNSPGPEKGPGSFEWNLAEARAAMVKQYLVKNGIDPERLLAKGYSNTEMRFPRPVNAEQQSANRRVEVRVRE